MKNLLVFSYLFIIFLYSCSKECSCEKDTEDIQIIKTLTIDDASHTFINDDGKHYFENTLFSQQDCQIYQLEMIKGTEYRISTSQPEALIKQTNLTLTNMLGDTVAQSSNEGIGKSFIVIKAPQSTSYYLRVTLERMVNPIFSYRLYFEELIDKAFSISGLDWQYDGNWTVISPDKVELTNYGSRIFRHLRCVSPITGNPDLAYTIKSNTNKSPNFGFIMNSSEDLLPFTEYAYELSITGFAFLTSNIDAGYGILTLNGGSISYDWGSLTNVYMDFSTGIKVEVKYNGSNYSVYMNGTYLRNINGSLNNFNILLEDCGDGISSIEDIQLTY